VQQGIRPGFNCFEPGRYGWKGANQDFSGVSPGFKGLDMGLGLGSRVQQRPIRV
jgi:hypothetical protein